MFRSKRVTRWLRAQIAIALALSCGSESTNESSSTGASPDGGVGAQEMADGSGSGGSVGRHDAASAEENISTATSDATIDSTACFVLFHACSIDDECCAPNRCLAITGPRLCQREGPAPEAGGSCARQGQGCFNANVCCGGLVCCSSIPCALHQGQCEVDCSAGCGDR